MNDTEHSTYDPFISGLEPEPYQTVLEELFSGIKNYLELPDEEPEPEPEPEPETDSLSGYRPDENTPQSSSALDVSKLVHTEHVDPTPKTRVRQYAVFRCGACAETFVSEFVLEHHEAKMHPELFGWHCSICDVHFESLRYASDHALMTHSDGEMPVLDNTYMQYRRQGLAMFMQLITRRSSDFVKEYLVSREKRSIMTTSFFTYSKCELQAVYTGNIGLVLYHQSKSQLISNSQPDEHLDLVDCLKKSFIYGNFISRVPLITYTPPMTVYKTLTFSNMPPKGRKIRPAKQGNSIGDIVSPKPSQRIVKTTQAYVVRTNIRSAPYAQQRVRTVCRVPVNGHYYRQAIPIRQTETPVYYSSIQVQP